MRSRIERHSCRERSAATRILRIRQKSSRIWQKKPSLPREACTTCTAPRVSYEYVKKARLGYVKKKPSQALLEQCLRARGILWAIFLFSLFFETIPASAWHGSRRVCALRRYLEAVSRDVSLGPPPLRLPPHRHTLSFCFFGKAGRGVREAAAA